MKNAALIFVFALVACGSDSQACPPGQQVECSCSNGESSFQICSPDGTSFGECECPDDPPPTTPTTSQGAGGVGGDGGTPTTTSAIDGGNGPGPTVNTGGGPGSGGSPVTSNCYDEALTGTLVGDPATLGSQGVCTSAQIDESLACFGADSDQFACNSFLGGSEACAACLFGGTDVWGAIIDFGNFAVANWIVCEALVQNKPTCTTPVAALFVCQVSTCSSCTTQGDYDACFVDAELGICSAFASDISASCQSLTTTVSPECAGSTFEDVYVDAGTQVCGS